jgi:hypothetical protein
MAKDKARKQNGLSEEVAQNPGARKAATNTDPNISLEEARNAVAGESPNAAGGSVPSTAENHVPSESDPNATDLPTSGSPDSMQKGK